MKIAPFVALLVVTASAESYAQKPSPADAAAAIKKAYTLFHTKAAAHGGYVWRYSDDFKHGVGEGIANENIIWVQPPGTPAVGLAFLEIYETTKDKAALQAAVDAANALVQGQLHSGGWYYSITFDPKDRLKWNYRKSPSRGKPRVRVSADSHGGWSEWRRRRYKTNMTMMDDEVTQSALMLLTKVDKALGFKNKEIHEAAEYGLKSILRAQYPIGAWSHNYDRFPRKSPSKEYYPVIKASFPKSWSRKWTKDFNGCYELNDEITPDAIITLLEAYRVYGDKKYLAAAERGGQFLILAQLPDPQPAWAQQYDRHMHPVWERGFEPPAITGYESQSAMQCLLTLYERTGNKKYLTPVGRALPYLKKSLLSDGKLARFYELKTNKPLYFTRKYQLTYNRGDMPKHYGFIMESHLNAIGTRYERLKSKGPDAKPPQPSLSDLRAQAGKVIAAMDDRGAWLEPGWTRDRNGRKVRPRAGIANSATFIKNIGILCEYLRRAK